MLAAPADPDPSAASPAADSSIRTVRARAREGSRPSVWTRGAPVDGRVGLGIGRRSVSGAATDGSSPPSCRPTGRADGGNITRPPWRGRDHRPLQENVQGKEQGPTRDTDGTDPRLRSDLAGRG